MQLFDAIASFLLYYESMLRSTWDLLVRIHNFFDEIGYKPTAENLDGEKVLDRVIYTINHAKELDDALFVAREFFYYLKKQDKFLKKLTKYSMYWGMLKYNGREEVAVVKDKEAIGSYYITNIYGSNYKDVYISGQTFGKDLLLFECKDGYFSFGKECDYYLRYAKLSSSKMVLTDKKKNNIATIVLSKDYGVFLENNKTKYELELYDWGIAFFDKKYIDTLKGDPDLDIECKASIQWDIVDENGEYGLSRLDVYDEEADLELMLTIAASCFLVFRSYLRNSRSGGMLLTSVIASNMIIRRH